MVKIAEIPDIGRSGRRGLRAPSHVQAEQEQGFVSTPALMNKTSRHRRAENLAASAIGVSGRPVVSRVLVVDELVTVSKFALEIKMNKLNFVEVLANGEDFRHGASVRNNVASENSSDHEFTLVLSH